MIHLKRERTSGAIPTAFRGKKRQERELYLLKWHLDPHHADLKSSLWRRAKPQLSRESAGKCAYCDAPASAVAYCDVEHFRPKSVYWWLALCYDNYLFACQICNQGNKGDQFPVYGVPIVAPAVSGTMTETQLTSLLDTFAPDPLDKVAVTHFHALWAAEGAGFLNPYFCDPEPSFAYVPYPALGEVKMMPEPTVTAEQRRAAQDSIDGYDLNRYELGVERFKQYQILDAAHRGLLKEPGNAELMEILAFMMRQDRAFCGMARYFVRRLWRIPGL